MGRMGRRIGDTGKPHALPVPPHAAHLHAGPAGRGRLHARTKGRRVAIRRGDQRRSGVRLWSRGGHDWAPKLPELESLTGLGDAVLDGEMIVATPDGRADFELLTTRLNRRPGDPTPGPPVSLYVFDILRHHGQDIRNRPWSERRAILDGLELAERTQAGPARPSYPPTAPPCTKPLPTSAPKAR